MQHPRRRAPGLAAAPQPPARPRGRVAYRHERRGHHDAPVKCILTLPGRRIPGNRTPGDRPPGAARAPRPGTRWLRRPRSSGRSHRSACRAPDAPPAPALELGHPRLRARRTSPRTARGVGHHCGSRHSHRRRARPALAPRRPRRRRRPRRDRERAPPPARRAARRVGHRQCPARRHLGRAPRRTPEPGHTHATSRPPRWRAGAQRGRSAVAARRRADLGI